MAVKLDPHATQPSGNQLISYADLKQKIERWERSPLVRAYAVGRSQLDRDIFLLALSKPENLERAERIKTIARESRRSLVHYTLLGEPQMREVDLEKLAEHTMPVLLVHCGSFGFEAAHIEAAVKLIELLLDGSDPRVEKILTSAIVLIMPMVNPDARELALDQWRKYPLSPGWPGIGNSYGFIMNRDFYFLSQPENRAVHKVVNEWRPTMALDTHEDMAFLGVTRGEECWTAPFCQPQHPELHPRMLELVKEYSRAIVEGWKRRGFRYWHDENGSFFSYLALDGRFDTHFDLHGIPCLFTESARTPGTARWEDRIDHKVEAALAFCEKAAGSYKELLIEQYSYWREQIEKGNREAPKAFIIPRGPRQVRDRGAVNRLIEILLLHDIQVYFTQEPYPAYVVPLGQPDRAVISAMLKVERWNPLSLPTALDVECLSFESLPLADRQRLLCASLEAVEEVQNRVKVLPSFVPTIRSHFLLSNNETNVRAVNALLRERLEVRWILGDKRGTENRNDLGSFLVRDQTGLAQKIILDMGATQLESNKNSKKSVRLSLPRIAVYVGQGADERNVTFRGETLWALDFLGFSYVGVDEEAICSGILRNFDVLILPSGSAIEMYRGWNTRVQNYQYPWQVPGEPKGLGEKGAREIVRFIEEGGCYIGIGSGGGSFACKEVAGICDASIADHGIGQARVYLKIKAPSHPVLFGYKGYRDQSGEWHDGIMPSLYFCDLLWPHMDTYAGPVFRPGPQATVLATFCGVDFEDWTEYIVKPPKSFMEDNAAIIFQRRGQGSIILFAINLGFRAQWQANYRLLSNAIYSWNLKREA